MNEKSTQISGFPELLPEEQLILEKFLQIVREQYALYGFTPIETPAVEKKTVLISKGGNEKEIYALSRLKSQEGQSPDTDMALHFDLTVPLARYVSAHKDDIVFPFRRYQIQKVWRGERAQAGRYREFYQCDIDVIARGKLPIMVDAEMPAIIYSLFERFSLGPICIRINNRKIVTGYFERYNFSPHQIQEILRVIDKAEKISRQEFIEEFEKVTHLSQEDVSLATQFLLQKRSSAETLKMLRERSLGDLYEQGVEELEMVIEGMKLLGVPQEVFVIDLSIARGLDYYTGTIYETLLVDHPELGSVCSGGRYDDLTNCFGEEKLPGVGISLGLTRLVVTLLKKGVLQTASKTPAQVLVSTMSLDLFPLYLQIGKDLRSLGIATEVFFDPTQALKVQMKYADRKGFRFVVLVGEQEREKKVLCIKNMASGESECVPEEKFLEHIAFLLKE